MTKKMKKHVAKKGQKEIAKKELRIIEEGLDMGRLLIKKRAGLYER